MKKKSIIAFFLAGLSAPAVNAQATAATNTYGATNYLGWDITSGGNPLYLTTAGSVRMCFNGNTGPTAGYVGLGPGFIAPNQLFTVNGGNINLNSGSNAYMLGNQNVLWHNNAISNIFLGIGAGAAHGSVNSQNTFLGNNAGFNSTGAGAQSTFVGTEAGYTSVNTSWAVCVGYRAGYSNTNINNATFVGYLAGSSSVGTSNSFFGSQAGSNNGAGIRNNYFGSFSGQNSTGSDNCFFGVNSGVSNGTFSRNTCYGNYTNGTGLGDDNTFLGFNTANAGAGSRNVAIGSRALQVSSLGASDNVVIGYNSCGNITNGNFNAIMGGQTAANLNGSNNTFVGYSSASTQTTGSNNASLGYKTGVNVKTGNNNTFVGASADALNPNANLTNAAAIGANAKVVSNNTMILGDNNVKVGIGLSGITPGPGNSLEINTSSTPTTPNTCSGTGFSGLRFRDLTTASTPCTNPGAGMLTVDANGDVIYVTAPTGTGTTLGSACGSAPNPLPAPWYVPLNNFDFYFSDDAPLVDKVHVGYMCNQGIGKFNVTTAFPTNPLNPAESYSIHSINTGFNTSYAFSYGTGVYGEANATTGSTFEKGVWGKATGTREAIGVFGEADLCAGPAYGGFFSSLNSNNSVNYGMAARGSNAVNTNYGVESEASGGQYAYGGYFIGSNSSSINIGVSGIGYATTYPGSSSYPAGSNIGIYGLSNFNGTGNPGNDWAGWFDGDVNVNGTGYISSGTWAASDKRFKTDIKKLENVSEKIKKLNGYSYKFDQEAFKAKRFDGVTHLGLLAQELKEVFPELVRVDKEGYYAVNYEGMVPVLLEVAKTQQTQLEDQQNKLDDMQKQLDELKALVKGASSSQTMPGSVELSNKNVIVLNQNVPNPFAESTNISYVVPEQFSKAQIIFSGMDGQVIKTYEIREKGAGQLNVFANDLSGGTYTYTLVVDGKIIDTKKMQKQ